MKTKIYLKPSCLFYTVALVILTNGFVCDCWLPTNQHIIQTVKMQYRKRPLNKVLSTGNCTIMVFGDLFLKEINLNYICPFFPFTNA